MVYQAGAIAVRRTVDDAKILIVRAKRSPADWIFPKGHIEPGETAAQTAVRELLEEGGVIGEVEELIGVSSVRSGVRDLEVSYFRVKYIGDGRATDEREKRWVSFDIAKALLTYDDVRRYAAIVERACRFRTDDACP